MKKQQSKRNYTLDSYEKEIKPRKLLFKIPWVNQQQLIYFLVVSFKTL